MGGIHKDITSTVMWFISQRASPVTLLLLLVATASGFIRRFSPHQQTSSSFLPYERGSHNTTHVFLPKVTTIGLDENIDVYLPTDAGAHKVVFFIDGFGGVMPGASYSVVRTGGREGVKALYIHGGKIVFAGWKQYPDIHGTHANIVFVSTVCTRTCCHTS